MSTFFKLPATLVVRGSLYRVHTKVEWLMVSPRAQLSSNVACKLCPDNHQEQNYRVSND